MKRVLAVLVGALLVLSGMAGSTSEAADPPAPPVITSTTGGYDGDSVLFEATSDAPYVLFRLSNAVGGPYVMGSPTPPDADGVFRGAVPWRGLLTESFATAVNCTAPTLESCDTVAGRARSAYHMATAQLSNKSQVIDPTVQTARIVVPPMDGQQVWLEIFYFGTPVRRLDEFAPGEHEVEIPALRDADYQLWLTRCSLVNPLVCDSPRADLVPQLYVRRAPNARFAFDCNCAYHAELNPNGDGIQERASFEIIPDHAVPLSSGTWRMIDRTGSTVIGPRTIGAVALAGNAPIVVDPRAEELRLADGIYRLKFSVAGTIAGTTRRTLLERRVEVWNSRSLRGIRANAQTFYPVVDGYRDTIDLAPGFQIRHLAWMKVLRADGSTVRTYQPPWVGSWNGRSASGSLARPGQYRLAFHVVASESLPTTFQTPLFNLSHKRLVTKTFRRTVTAKASLLRNQSQRCGRIRVESTGAIRYLSRVCQPFIGEGSRATGLHQVRLPAGDPVSVRVGASGRSLDRWHDDEGKLINLTRSDGRRVWTIVGPGHGTWFTSALRPPHLFRPDRRLRWLFETYLGREFRIRTFTVVYRYRVLQ